MNKEIAIITGASAGLGKSFVKKLSNNYQLVLIARNEEKLNALASQLQNKAIVLAADLTATKDLKKVEDYISKTSSLKLLVNNAGMGTYGEFCNLDIEKETSQINLNITALTRLTHAALNNMSSGASIINVASLAGFMPAPYNAVYAASKAYVKSFTSAVHQEVKQKGIYLQALCPGFTHTEFHERASINASNLPDMMWSNADDVVDASIKAMQNKEEMVLPGVVNKATAVLSSFLPDRTASEIAAYVMKRTSM